MWWIGPVVLFVLAAWVFIDALKRKMLAPFWAAGVFFLAAIVLPIYLAVRSLKPGETREGGRAWNILKNFALTWTLLVFLVAAISIPTAAANTRAESAGEAAGVALGVVAALMVAGLVWFVPMISALLLGFFLKKSSIVERGPTGGLAGHSLTDGAERVQEA